MNWQVSLIVFALLPGLACCQSDTPACSDNRYGTAVQARQIELAMLNGSIEAVQTAIRAAQITRGTALGCSETSYSYINSDRAAPSSATVRAQWQRHVDSAESARAQYDACPGVGRAGGAYALGGWLARGYGRAFNTESLQAISGNFLDTQYLPSRSPGRLTSWPGLFAYSETLAQAGTCLAPAVISDALLSICDASPLLCVRYQTGRFAGQQFVIGDYSLEPELRDGGAAFDHAWAGVMMVEAALASTDIAARERYRHAALAAGDYALQAPLVRNHNYTAKLIWLLAVLYDWTGEERFKSGLIDRLERNLLPAVLMDSNADGIVDGLTIRFADLRAPAARRPGRLWDAHNSLPWYQAMNTWAMLESYLAFVARGDDALAARLRPHVLAMLDNLAGELDSDSLAPGSGTTQLAYVFASALWKFADSPQLQRAAREPVWENALWGIWNQGLGATPGDDKTATAAMVHLRAEGLRYQSYRTRENKRLSGLPTDTRASGAWYDPARSGEGLMVLATSSSRMFVSWYTYDPVDSKRQVWLVAEGSFDGREFTGEVLITSGTRFGAAFSASDVRREPWGTMRLQFENCARATLHYSSTVPGFGSGRIGMVKLANTDGLLCQP
jgi:hypothetical protein